MFRGLCRGRCTLNDAVTRSCVYSAVSMRRGFSDWQHHHDVTSPRLSSRLFLHVLPLPPHTTLRQSLFCPVDVRRRGGAGEAPAARQYCVPRGDEFSAPPDVVDKTAATQQQQQQQQGQQGEQTVAVPAFSVSCH